MKAEMCLRRAEESDRCQACQVAIVSVNHEAVEVLLPSGSSFPLCLLCAGSSLVAELRKRDAA